MFQVSLLNDKTYVRNIMAFVYLIERLSWTYISSGLMVMCNRKFVSFLIQKTTITLNDQLLGKYVYT